MDTQCKIINNNSSSSNNNNIGSLPFKEGARLINHPIIIPEQTTFMRLTGTADKCRELLLTEGSTLLSPILSLAKQNLMTRAMCQPKV